MKRLVGFTVCAAVVVGCANKPACPVVKPAITAPQVFLWKAQRPGGGPIWLYGTIHNASEHDVPAVALAALDQSRHFVSELGDSEPDGDRASELVRLPRGPGLDAQLPADEWFELRDALRGVIREDELKRTRPWYAMARLSATVAPPPSPTMDFALARRARARGLDVRNLESWRAQLTALADTVTIADLRDALRERKTMRCSLDALRAAYVGGNLPEMERQLLIPATTKLRVDRSRGWLPAIEQLSEQGGGFVAVGLGHLLGPDGIPALLAAKGYQVDAHQATLSGLQPAQAGPPKSPLNRTPTPVCGKSGCFARPDLAANAAFSHTR